jgi:hypothetical protein
MTNRLNIPFLLLTEKKLTGIFNCFRINLTDGAQTGRGDNVATRNGELDGYEEFRSEDRYIQASVKHILKNL